MHVHALDLIFLEVPLEHQTSICPQHDLIHATLYSLM